MQPSSDKNLISANLRAISLIYDIQQKTKDFKRSNREALKMLKMPSEQKVLYGNCTATVRTAGGVRGVLCKSANGDFFFRVYAQDHSFTDYELRHDDLEATIAPDELASFYHVGDERILDHDPGVLGLSTTD